MKKTPIRLLAALLAVCLLLTAAPLSGFVGPELFRKAQAYDVGDHIEFGTYPQTRVDDETLIESLSKVPKTWKSYGYYSRLPSSIDTVPSNCMQFADFFFGPDKYRAVLINDYRPDRVNQTLGSYYRYQDQNGYLKNRIYYFLYEPISWRILDPNDHLVLCEMILDSQNYQNTVISAAGLYYQDNNRNTYASDYELSSIRNWLNYDFYHTAFSYGQKGNIQKNVTLKYLLHSITEAYNSEIITDTIFLLSESDVRNTVYNFSEDGAEKDAARIAHGTDYAIAQGLRTWYNANPIDGDNTADWWARTAYDSLTAYRVHRDGIVYGYREDIRDTYVGVRPACKLIALKDDITLSPSLFSERENTVTGIFENYSVSHIINPDNSVKTVIDEITINGNTYPVNPELLTESTATLYLNKLVDAKLEDGMVTELFGYDYSIAVFSTERSLSVRTGDTMWLGFGLIEDGVLSGDWEKMALTLSNNALVSLSDYKSTEYGYSVQITGLKPGDTNLTITDPATGAHTIVTLHVKDVYSRTCSYDISKMPSFYPSGNGDSGILTNIYDLNGLYVNNYTGNKEGDVYSVSFDVYNANYHIAAVDIYDKENHWIGSKPVDAFETIDSFWDTGTEFYYLIADKLTGKLLTYEQHSFTKQTHIDIEVPEGGYFTISNNINESPGTFFYNGIDLLFDAVSTFIDLAASSEFNITDFDFIVTKEFEKDPTIREAVFEAFSDTAKDELLTFSQNVANNDISGACKRFTDFFRNLLDSANLNWTHLFETLTGVGESVLESLMGPAGITMEGCFAFGRNADKYRQANGMSDSINNEYASIYTVIKEGVIQNNGVIVNTEGNVDADSVLQVFRITNKNEVEIILNNDDPLQHCELYNICFVKDDTLVQPNGKVTVRIPIPAGMQGDTCSVYRKEPDGAWTIIDAHVQGNYLVFETDHFSLYAVAGNEAPLSVASLPRKTDYKPGEKLDTTGLTLLSGDKTVTQGFICSPTVLTGNGPQTITVRYAYGKTTFTVNVNGEEAYLIGDVDNDGKVTAGDARLALRRSVDLETYAPGTREYLACDIDGDGKVTAGDARLILRAAVGLETLSANTDAVKEEILRLYKAAVEDAAANAGYSAYTCSELRDMQASGIATLDKVLLQIAEKYAVSGDDAEIYELKKGDAAINGLPLCTLSDVSKIRSAKTEKKGENTVITLVMTDESMPLSGSSYIGQVSNTAPMWDRDVLPELNAIEPLKSYENPEMTYRGFTVTAELTPDGRLSHLTLTAPVIDIVLHNCKLLVNIGDFSVKVMREEVYFGFSYEDGEDPVITDCVHDWNGWSPVGENAGRHTRACKKCGAVEEGACTYGEKIPQDPENPGPATCTKDYAWYRQCALCGDRMNGADPRLDHAGKILNEEKSVAATCTETGLSWYECPLCGENGDTLAELKVVVPAPGHDAASEEITVDEDVVCVRCGKVLQPCFNTLVNAIKATDGMEFSGISKQENSGSVTDHDIRIDPSANASMQSSGVNLTEEDILRDVTGDLNPAEPVYTDYRWKSTRLYQDYPLRSSAYVSLLTSADISTVTVQKIDRIDFIDELPDSVRLQINHVNYINRDLTAFKALGDAAGDIVKITVKPADTNYLQCKDAPEDTPLTRAAGVDIRAYAEAQNGTDENDGSELELTCTDVTAGCEITYYFLETAEGDGTVYTPLASRYVVEYDTDLLLRLRIAVVLPTGADPTEVASGTVNLNSKETVTDYYIFSTQAQQ